MLVCLHGDPAVSILPFELDVDAESSKNWEPGTHSREWDGIVVRLLSTRFHRSIASCLVSALPTASFRALAALLRSLHHLRSAAQSLRRETSTQPGYRDTLSSRVSLASANCFAPTRAKSK